MRIAMVILLGVLTIAFLLLAGFEASVVVAFVYVLLALSCGMLTTYFAIGKMDMR
jgi:hypothetical protein